RGILFGAVLLILMVPSQVYLIPQYQIVQGLGLLETPWGIVLPGLFSAFGTFLMRQTFLSLPREMEEAARLDGCSQWQIFTKVMLPLAAPGLSAVAITTVLWSWNDLLWPLIVTTREDKMPLSVGIATLAGEHSTDYSMMMAASIMSMAPIFILFFSMQRRVISGLASSGLKG
ncbi:MAG: carbohydrate ABC transporter permease, partial [Actinomyces graevenitzii]|nr:carbohydrate ABC transporter permease [Actinomyces graevenitzii]